MSTISSLPFIELVLSSARKTKIAYDKTGPYHKPFFHSFRTEVEWNLIEINRFWYSAINENYKANVTFMQGYAARWIRHAIALGYTIESTGTIILKSGIRKYLQLHRGLETLWKQVFEKAVLEANLPKPVEEPVVKVPQKYNIVTNLGACLQLMATDLSEIVAYLFDCADISQNELEKIEPTLAKKSMYVNNSAHLTILLYANRIVVKQADRVYREAIIAKMD